jgi:uncharacterized membrane protein YfcA
MDPIVLIPLLLLIGLLAGMIAGLLGVGGGVIFTPVLFYLFSNAGVEQPVLWSVASGLVCTFVAASSSSIRQWIQNNLYLRDGVMVGLFGAVGTWIGKQVTTSSFYQEEEFAILFTVLLIYVAYSFVNRGSDANKLDAADYNTGPLSIGAASGTGLLGGILASLAGIGGGGAMVPLLHFAAKKPMHQAVSTSSLAIVFISLAGWGQLALLDPVGGGVSAYTTGFVDWGAAVPLFSAGFIGGLIGAWLSNKLSRRTLQISFAILALFVAANLLYEVYG